MSLNRLVLIPQVKKVVNSFQSGPDYVGLVKFLILPFLESPESLRVDCELSQTLQKIWIRVAFDSADKGKVFGRGGRNIQAIRTVITAAAATADQSVYLDIYGGHPQDRDEMSDFEEREERLPPPRPSQRRVGNGSPRPFAKPRSRQN